MLRIKELRQKKGLSQQKLADKLDISQSAVNSYENGINEPDIRMLVLFSNFFEVSIDYIVGHSDIPNPVEKTNEYHLNDAEMTHMENYRSLPKNLRDDIDRLMADIQKNSRG